MEKKQYTSTPSYEEFARQRQERRQRGEGLPGPVKFRYENHEWFYGESESIKARYEVRDKDDKTIVRADVLDIKKTPNREYWLVNLHTRPDLSADLHPLGRPTMTQEDEFLSAGEALADIYFDKERERELEAGRNLMRQRMKQKTKDKGHDIDI